ncbi:helix-turn-helix transcriptional regulator [Kitasatospora mediocidica]|uniref:helix-turn-helix transcriptional regulator n=1 Tax=Kitasatospora mediocidica TaxID=58352 RepID=UPI00055FB113|nr:helix-turn-helix domain-containing protein [Kitasatospora mediocidica]
MTDATVVSANDELLTPAEVGLMTKLSPRTLADKRWRGTGPAFLKLSPGRTGHVRYRRSAVDAWLNGDTAAA